MRLEALSDQDRDVELKKKRVAPSIETNKHCVHPTMPDIEAFIYGHFH